MLAVDRPRACVCARAYVCVCVLGLGLGGTSADRTAQLLLLLLLEPIMITSDLRQPAHFTALSIKVSATLYVTRYALQPQTAG